MPTQPASAPRPSRLTRRAFLGACGGGVLGLGAAALYARYVEPSWVELARLDMELPGLAPEWSGRGLVHISDLHVPGHDSPHLRRQLRRCTELAPDLIVITGDFVSGCDPSEIRELAHVLPLLQARLGVVAVLGNHDFNLGRPLSAPAPVSNCVQGVLEDAGVRVLRNAFHLVELPNAPGASLQIVGLDEWWTRRTDAEAAFADVDAHQPCIALVHNPDAYAVLCDRACHWILCGHTHGGYVRIPLLGAPILPVENRRFDAGLFRLGAQRLYVNRGLAPGRVRFNCRPEITLFTLSPRRK